MFTRVSPTEYEMRNFPRRPDDVCCDIPLLKYDIRVPSPVSSRHNNAPGINSTLAKSLPTYIRPCIRIYVYIYIHTRIRRSPGFAISRTKVEFHSHVENE